MKKLKQHALKPLFLALAVLLLASNANAWTCKLKQYGGTGDKDVTMTWNASAKTWTGTIPAGRSGVNYNVQVDDKYYGWQGGTYGVNDNTQDYLTLSLGGNAFRIDVSTVRYVTIKTGTNEGDVKEIRFSATKDTAAESYDYYLWNSQSWDQNTSPKFSGNPLTTTITDPAGVEFGIKVTESGNTPADTDLWYRVTEEVNPAPGETKTYTLSKTGGSGKFSPTLGDGSYSVTLHLDENNMPKSISVTNPNSQGSGEHGDYPANLHISGWQNDANVMNSIEMTQVSEGVFQYVYPGYNGAAYGVLYFRFSEMNGNSIAYTYTAKSSDQYIGLEDPKEIERSEGSKEQNFLYSSYNLGYREGPIKFTVDFTKTPATVTVTKGPKEYYFIGDMNQWYSKEFTDSGAPKTIDADMLKDNKDKWKFTYDEVNNWYTFSCDLLAGQFQIFDGTSWSSTEVYSNSTLVTADKDNKSDEDREKDFETYLGNKVQVDPSFEIWTKLRRGNGQNLHLPSNAVQDAQILFKPAVLDENGDVKEDGQIAIIGTPVNYYIFYDRSGDKDRNVESDPLRAHINSDNPNKNNYYIPFNTVNIDGKDHDFKNVQIDGQTDYNHMNYTEGNDYNRNGYKMLRAKFYKGDGENVTWLTKQEILELLPDASDDVVESLKKGMLPNGISVMDREIWYAKVPNGFACPAGAKFTVAFRNSNDDESYRDPATKTTPYWTALGTFNLYFFDPIHIHVNSEDVDILEYVDNVKISYRIYTYDKDYNTVVVDPNDDQKFLDEKLATRGNVPTEKANTTVGGWVELGTKHFEHSKWNVMEELILNKNQWRIKEEAATRATTQTEVNRKKISAGLTNAYVQYKFTYTPKEGVTQPSHIQFNQPFDVYLPKVATMGRNADEQKLNGNDRYLVLNPYDETYTGIDNIFEDFGDDAFNGEDATPVYYNLQGVRVANPTKGLYIKVTGSKSEKVLF